VELCVDEDFEIAVEVKGRDDKLSWEIIGIYIAPKEDMGVTERLATQTDSSALCPLEDHLCGLVVRVSGCSCRAPGFDSRRCQIL
jgi:hypothetical protein